MQSVQSQEENERIELEDIEVLLVLGYVRSTTLRIYCGISFVGIRAKLILACGLRLIRWSHME